MKYQPGTWNDSTFGLLDRGVMRGIRLVVFVSVSTFVEIGSAVGSFFSCLLLLAGFVLTGCSLCNFSRF